MGRPWWASGADRERPAVIANHRSAPNRYPQSAWRAATVADLMARGASAAKDAFARIRCFLRILIVSLYGGVRLFRDPYGARRAAGRAWSWLSSPCRSAAAPCGRRARRAGFRAAALRGPDFRPRA